MHAQLNAPTEKVTPEWLTPDAGAEYLSLTRRTIDNYISQGLLPAYRFGPRMVRLRKSDLDGMAQRVPTGPRTEPLAVV